MSKTPIQQLIQNLNDMPRYTDGYVTMKVSKLIDMATALLPTEREVIMDAFEFGYMDGSEIDSEHYFTTKFNDNEHTKS